MDIQKIREEQFEAVLRVAALDVYEEEMAEIPSDEELERDYSFSERHERKMKRLFRKVKHMNTIKTIRSVSYRVAAAYSLLSAFFIVVLFFNGDFRSIVKTTLSKTFENTVEPVVPLIFSESEPIYDSFREWKPEYIPEGFSEKAAYETGGAAYIEYVNENKETIVYEFIPDGILLPALFEIEHDECEQFLTNGLVYYLFCGSEVESKNCIFWESGGNRFLIEGICDKYELLKMALVADKTIVT